MTAFVTASASAACGVSGEEGSAARLPREGGRASDSSLRGSSGP